jgi:hypothetical protein
MERPVMPAGKISDEMMAFLCQPTPEEAGQAIPDSAEIEREIRELGLLDDAEPETGKAAEPPTEIIIASPYRPPRRQANLPYRRRGDLALAHHVRNGIAAAALIALGGSGVIFFQWLFPAAFRVPEIPPEEVEEAKESGHSAPAAAAPWPPDEWQFEGAITETLPDSAGTIRKSHGFLWLRRSVERDGLSADGGPSPVYTGVALKTTLKGENAAINLLGHYDRNRRRVVMKESRDSITPVEDGLVIYLDLDRQQGSFEGKWARGEFEGSMQPN